MTIPNPIASDVFADGELTNELKWYQRVFQVINGIISNINTYNTDTGWLDCPGLTANWTEGPSMQARKIGPIVYIVGGLKRANTALANQETAFNLPAGIPGPGASAYFRVSTGQTDVTPELVVNPDGTCDARAKSSTSLAVGQFLNVSVSYSTG